MDEAMNKYSSKRFVKHFYDNVEVPYHWREGMTPEERDAWKRGLKEKVRELMAFPETMYEKPIVNLLAREERDTYWIERYEISPEPALWMVFLLLTPKTASEENKTPAVLCAPGSLTMKECLAGEDYWDLGYDPDLSDIAALPRFTFANAMAQHYVRQGFTALACEDLSIGEHHDGVMDTRTNVIKYSRVLEKLLTPQGRSVMGVTVELRMAMLQWLKERPFVDREKLAVSGHSLGVDSLSLLVTLDEDVKAFVRNDYLYDSKERAKVCVPPIISPEDLSPYHMCPGIHRWFNYPDLLAAYAPRKLFITEGGRTYQLKRVEKAYEELGAKENFRYDYYKEYADPENRLYDDAPLKMGMTHEEWHAYSYVVEEKHFFKYQVAVPWLKEALK